MKKPFSRLLTNLMIGSTVFLPIHTQAGFIEDFYQRQPHRGRREAIGQSANCDRRRLRL